MLELLNTKPIRKDFKKEILKTVITKIAYGSDGLPNTEDDMLSQNTLNRIWKMIESDTVIDGKLKKASLWCSIAITDIRKTSYFSTTIFVKKTAFYNV